MILRMAERLHNCTNTFDKTRRKYEKEIDHG